MTLILCKNTDSYVCQVTDRRLTLSGSGDVAEEHVNKNLIYVARDGIVAIGVTGIAFLGRKPSDLFLAERLSGRPLDPLAYWQPGRAARWYDVGAAILQLAAIVRDVPKSLSLNGRIDWKRYPFALSLCGWRWNRRRRRTMGSFAAVIQKGWSTLDVHSTWLDLRRWRTGQDYLTATPKHRRVVDVFDALAQETRGMDGFRVRDALADAMGRISKKLKVVGQDTLSILISPPQHRTVIVRYHNVVPHLVRNWKTKKYEQPVGFSPWILGPRVVAAPMTCCGVFAPEIGVGGPYKFTFEMPKSEGSGLVMMMGPHLRPHQTEFYPPNQARRPRRMR